MNVYARCTKNGKCSRAGSLLSSPLEHTSTALHWPIASAGLEKYHYLGGIKDHAEIVVLSRYDHRHCTSPSEYRFHQVAIGKTRLK